MAKQSADLRTFHVMNLRTVLFRRNLNKIETRDDVLTTLIHLGYFSYDSTRRTARIPNLETRNNFLTQINSEKTKEHSCKYRKDTSRQINQICAFVCSKEKNDF